MKQTQNSWENLILLDTPWATAPLITTTSVTLETLDLVLALPPTTLMTHCGMVRDVAVQAPAVSSTHLHGSVSLYPSIQVMTWRLGIVIQSMFTSSSSHLI